MFVNKAKARYLYEKGITVSIYLYGMLDSRWSKDEAPWARLMDFFDEQELHDMTFDVYVTDGKTNIE